MLDKKYIPLYNKESDCHSCTSSPDWIDIPGYGGAYKVSRSGEVKGPRKVLKPFPSTFGSAVVRFGNVVHHIGGLVAWLYLGAPHRFCKVTYKNGDKFDNRVENIEFTCVSR